MPQHKSAKKRVKTSLLAQTRNRAARSELRGSIKQTTEAAKENKEEAIKTLQSLVDRATNSKLIHRNKAARLKSRMSKKS